MTRSRWVAALLLVFTLVAAGCGGGDDGGASDGGDDPSEEAASDEEEDPEPEGQVLVDDDFDDDENLWDPDSIDIDGEQDASIEDGAFVVDFESDAYAAVPDDQALVPNQSWPGAIDGAIEEMVDIRVDAEVTLATPGAVGLACRIADVAPDATDFRAYFFQVSSTGQVNLAEVDAEGAFNAIEVVPEIDEDDQPDEIPVDGAAFEPEDGGTYELSMTCVDGDDGVELTGSIDGEEVVSGVDDEDPVESGQAGILSSQSRLATEVAGFEPFEISVDSVTITNLGEEIDDELLEEGPAEPSEEPTDPSPPEEDPTEPGSAVLGEATDPSGIADAGTDPDADLLADECFAGTFESCDTLFLESAEGSAYQQYGGSCGGRLEVVINGDCAAAAQFASQPGTTSAEDIAEFGEDPTFDELALACEAGDLEACDELYLTTPVGSGYESFGSTCGARDTVEYEGNCIGDGS